MVLIIGDDFGFIVYYYVVMIGVEGIFDILVVEDDIIGRKIGGFDKLYQFINGNIWIIDSSYCVIDYFVEVVW